MVNKVETFKKSSYTSLRTICNVPLDIRGEQAAILTEQFNDRTLFCWNKV